MKSKLTLSEIESLCRTHRDEALKISDIRDSIDPTTGNNTGKGTLWLIQGINEAIRTTRWKRE